MKTRVFNPVYAKCKANFSNLLEACKETRLKLLGEFGMHKGELQLSKILMATNGLRISEATLAKIYAFIILSGFLINSL